jgi:hypothetical protein
VFHWGPHRINSRAAFDRGTILQAKRRGWLWGRERRSVHCARRRIGNEPYSARLPNGRRYDFVTVRIPNTFELEYCQHLNDLEEHGRLGQSHARANSAAKSKCRFRLGLLVVQVSQRVKHVWIWVCFGVTVDCPGMGVNSIAKWRGWRDEPDVCNNKRSFRNEYTLINLVLRLVYMRRACRELQHMSFRGWPVRIDSPRGPTTDQRHSSFNIALQ